MFPIWTGLLGNDAAAKDVVLMSLTRRASCASAACGVARKAMISSATKYTGAILDLNKWVLVICLLLLQFLSASHTGAEENSNRSLFFRRSLVIGVSGRRTCGL